MKLHVLTLALALALAAGGATAQTSPSGSPSPPPAGAGAASPATSSAPGAPAAGKSFKDARAACLGEIKDKGIKGPERHQALVDCVNKANPKFGAHMACAQDANAKSLDKDTRKAFMKECLKGKG